MIKIGPKYAKLKTSLHLTSHRLKLLQSKKAELSEKLKREIANFIEKGKYMQAKIKAQRIIREEASVEAMELVEMYCEEILERYELFQQMREPDVSLRIPITSLIWVAPYYQTYIGELKEISKQLVVKYGTRFCTLALTNKTGSVNPELIERVRQFAPSDEKIEDCLRNICSKYRVAYRANEERHMEGHHENANEKEPNVNSSKLSEDKTEFHAEGINETDDSISSKKAFTEIMFKFKIQKSESQNSKSDSLNQEGNGKICSDAISVNNSTKSSSDTEVKDNSEPNVDLFNSNNDSSAESLTFDVSLNDQNCRCESGNKDFPRIALFGECNENINQKQELSTPVESHFYTDNVIYPDPPPPYSYNYFSESDDRTHSSEVMYKDFHTFQFPSCPTENPDAPSSAEKQKPKEKKALKIKRIG